MLGALRVARASARSVRVLSFRQNTSALTLAFGPRLCRVGLLKRWHALCCWRPWPRRTHCPVRLGREDFVQPESCLEIGIALGAMACHQRSTPSCPHATLGQAPCRWRARCVYGSWSGRIVVPGAGVIALCVALPLQYGISPVRLHAALQRIARSVWQRRSFGGP